MTMYGRRDDGLAQQVRCTNAGELITSFEGSTFSDMFNRLRVSNPETMFDSKLIHGKGDLFWDEVTTGAGSVGTWSQDTASVVLDVDNLTAGSTIRQTFMRFNYQPGKSQLVLMTGTLQKSGAGQAGIDRGWGFGDVNNGYFLNDAEGTIQLIERTSKTGTPADTTTAQSAWNLDKMDGTGPSKVTMDWTKSQIMFLGMEWLGVGSVLMGFIVDQKLHPVHVFHHANVLSGVYMSSPNLPLRYWISNDNSGGAATLEHICSTVISEGGTQDLGVSRSESTEGAFINANTTTIYYAVFGIRLKSTTTGASVDNHDGIVKLVDVSMMEVGSNDYHWELRINPTIASSGSVTWTEESNSVVETGVGDTVTTAGDGSVTQVTGGTVVGSGYVKGGKESGSFSQALDTALRIGVAQDGTPDQLWLVVRPLTSNSDVYGGLTWKEIS